MDPTEVKETVSYKDSEKFDIRVEMIFSVSDIENSNKAHEINSGLW